MSKTPFFITTAIAYPNGKPHIGHAYEYIAADTIARFKRLDGFETFFLTGTDEHGQKIAKAAQAANKTPKNYVDLYVEEFKKIHSLLNTSYDRFIRTTDADHYAACQTIWQRLVDNDDIYLGKYSGWYSIRDETFYQESETTISPTGIRISQETGNKVEWNEEESYFFRLSKYQNKLIELYETEPERLGPASRKNEILSFLKQDLKDLSVSRSTLTWGVPVPNNSNHVMYVWIDALTNYITALGYPDTNSEVFSKFWPANLHLIGKDIIRFHAIYWPAFLWSIGLELPKRIFAHGHLLNQGEKMSKSVGNVIDPYDLINKYGADAVRFFFLREITFGNDGNYSSTAITTRINADLANELGNLYQRSLNLVYKYCEKRIPYPKSFNITDKNLLAETDKLLPSLRNYFDNQEIHLALEAIWKILANTNKYFSAEQPWVLRNTNIERMQTVLYVTLEILRQISILLQPVLPTSAAKLLNLLAIPAETREFIHLDSRLKPDTSIPEPTIIFPRIENF